MRRVESIETFIKNMEKDSSIYILGAGKDGKSCYRNLMASGYEVKGFIDEDKKKRGTLIESAQVFLPEDIVDIQSNEMIFFICIGELSFYSDEDIESMAICSWITDKNKIIVFDRSEAVYQRFQWNCQQSKLVFTKTIMDFKTMILPNFLEVSNSVRKVFLSECHDLILPAVFNDYSMVDEGPYEIDEVKIKMGDIVIDAGANLGIFSAYAATIADKVYAFEPVPKTLKLLLMTQKLYDNKIEIIDKALSNRNGIEKMTDLEYLGQNRLCRYEFDNGNTISVETTTLDSFVEKFSIPNVDFIKADIEGAERNMLIGAQETLRRFAPKLAVCTYHLEDDPEVLEEIVMKANPNYKIIHKYQKMYAYI